MSLDGISYGTHGRTGKFGQLDVISVSVWGKIPDPGLLSLTLGVTLFVESEIIMSTDIISIIKTNED